MEESLPISSDAMRKILSAEKKEAEWGTRAMRLKCEQLNLLARPVGAAAIVTKSGREIRVIVASRSLRGYKVAYCFRRRAGGQYKGNPQVVIGPDDEVRWL